MAMYTFTPFFTHPTEVAVFWCEVVEEAGKALVEVGNGDVPCMTAAVQQICVHPAHLLEGAVGGQPDRLESEEMRPLHLFRGLVDNTFKLFCDAGFCTLQFSLRSPWSKAGKRNSPASRNESLTSMETDFPRCTGPPSRSSSEALECFLPLLQITSPDPMWVFFCRLLRGKG